MHAPFTVLGPDWSTKPPKVGVLELGSGTPARLSVPVFCQGSGVQSRISRNKHLGFEGPDPCYGGSDPCHGEPKDS